MRADNMIKLAWNLMAWGGICVFSIRTWVAIFWKESLLRSMRGEIYLTEMGY